MKINKARQSGLLLSPQEFFILASLVDGPKHGYAIYKRVLEITETRVKLRGATLYENLSRMLSAGIIARDGDIQIETGERRKIYKITQDGGLAYEEQCKIYNKAICKCSNELVPDFRSV